MGFKIRWKADYSVLAGLEEALATAAGETTQEIALNIRNDIRKSISTPYPPSSDEGRPPHLRSGALYDSVQVVSEWGGKGFFSGRFLSNSTLQSFVRIDTTEQTGKAYALALEDPSYFNRPFIRPAFDRAAGTFQTDVAQRLQRGFTRKTDRITWNGKKWLPY